MLSFVCLSIRVYVYASVRPCVRLSVYIYNIGAVVDDILSSSFSITEMPKIVLLKPFGCRMKTFHIHVRPSFEINVSPICDALLFAVNNDPSG